jgi:dihydroorotate dehydrogenase electron transfer subunit
VDGPRMFRVLGQTDEARSIRTVSLDGPLDGTPGQFVMVWVPGADEFPMSLSSIGARPAITYDIIGDGTRALAGLSAGSFLGIRGPYGRGFSVVGKRLLVVAGGTGMACLAPFVEMAAEQGSEVDVVLGARDKSKMFFEARARKAGATVHPCTDDGSWGKRALATELAAELMREESFDAMYSCGPEKMLIGLVRLAQEHRTEMQASLERIMKCGIGICDSCAIDGRHVCRDGPVFALSDLVSFKDLGIARRDLCGRKVPI